MHVEGVEAMFHAFLVSAHDSSGKLSPCNKMFHWKGAASLEVVAKKKIPAENQIYVVQHAVNLLH
jgi:hypothetical protein